MSPAEAESARPFGQAVRELVDTESDLLTSTGNVNWTAVADKVGIGYDTLRKAVSGERAPSPDVMEQVAAGLGVAPTYFPEYRLWVVQREFDVREVGWDKAIGNLKSWAAKEQKR